MTQAVYLAAWAAGLTFTLLFPRPPARLSQWTRPARLALFAAPLWVAGGSAGIAAIGSANSLHWTGRLIAAASVVTVLSLLAMVGTALGQLRRAGDALERQQMRWLVGSGVLAVSAGLVGWFIPQILLGDGLPTAWIGLSALPFVIGLGVALLRYRLFDLDVVLNRGLVYGLLTVSVVTVYLVVVTSVTSVMRGSATTPAAIVATAAVAVAVNPLRVLLQRGVDRMMYGDRDDPYSALSRLGLRLDDVRDEQRLLHAVADDIADALRVPYVAIDVDPLTQPGRSGQKAAVAH
ncbi:MAG: hypothetical protein ACRDWI_06905 [Jiangellaceae bacterium]